MKNKYRCLSSGVSKFLQGGLLASLAVAFLALPVASNAQETTSSIRGRILDASGNPVSGAAVVVEDQRNGVERYYSTSGDGLFLATRLLPGGPYSITVNGTKSVEVPSISVGDTYNLSVSLGAETEIEEIIAIGQQAALVETAAGPSATFNIDALENSVAFSRDISDVYGIDPRLMVDNDEDGFGINCAGKHPRFNNITLDGVSTSDRFGLNENGYATAVGMPFPYDAIEQISVELAPFDVTYGGFSACNINSVTKSGTNEWEAKTFYEFSNNDFRGDRISGDDNDYSLDSYDKTYYGFDVGGPILQDKLFFFAAYEKSEEPRFLARGYAGSGNGQERSWFTQDDFNTISSLAQSIYQYDTGGMPKDGVQESEKYIARLDWNINDNHNAAFIYSYFDGFQDRNSDDGSRIFEYSNHGYVKGAELETYTLKLSSQWNDALSTELFWSTSEMNDSQVTVGDKDFAEMQIGFGSRTVYIGADDSRQANSLSTQADYLKLSADYLVGDHVITAGYDSEKLDIFNIFVQHSRGGEYRFYDDSTGNDAACDALTPQERFDGVNGCSPTGLDRFRLGRPSVIYYGSGGGSNDPNDAAASFSNTLNALYLQDEIFFDQLDLTLVAGLRYEWFTSSDQPNYNANFEETTGYRNDAGLDGISLVQPRLGFTLGVSDELTLRGGMGLYSGGNPNVWISNAWSNDGITNAQKTRYEDDFEDETGALTFTVLPGFADSVELSGSGQPGYNVPQAMVDDVLATSTTEGGTRYLSFIDPDYKQPSEWKFALGGTWDMPWADMTLDFDYLHTRGNDPAYYVDVSQEIVGTTIIGTPIYDYVYGRDNFMLTNSSENPSSDTFSLVLRKDFDFGLSTLFGYAYTQAEDVVPMTSSVAGSNFDNVAVTDINYPKAGDSNWVVPHRFTLYLDYAKTFFGDSETRFTLMGYLNEGQPQTYVMQGLALEGDGYYGRHLLYVPTGPTDPNVIFDWDAETNDAFFAWVDKNGLKPGLVSRNEYNTGWSTRFDLRISQDIPLGGDFRGRLYLKIYNVGNMLSDKWGKITDAEFYSPQIVNAGVDDESGRFIYTGFSDNPLQTTVNERSLWEARLGIDIKFGGGY